MHPGWEPESAFHVLQFTVRHNLAGKLEQQVKLARQQKRGAVAALASRRHRRHSEGQEQAASQQEPLVFLILPRSITEGTMFGEYEAMIES